MVLKQNTKCSQGERKKHDIKDEDKIYINEAKKMRDQLPQCELRSLKFHLPIYSNRTLTILYRPI